QRLAQIRQRCDVGIGGWNDEIDLLRRCQAGQHFGKAWVGGRWDQVETIRSSMLEDESIEIAADHEEPGILGLQTADQVAARPRPAAGEEIPLVLALSCRVLRPRSYMLSSNASGW